MKYKRVAIICPYPKNCAPSQRLKYEQYLTLLETKGYEFSIYPFFGRKAWQILYKNGEFLKKALHTILGYYKRLYLLFKLSSFDILYIHLWVTPIGFPVFEWLFSAFGKKIIYDIDDLVFLGVKSKANARIPFLKTSSKTNVLIKNANHVITCTPYLDNYAKQFNPNSTDISSTIDLNEYTYVPKKIDLNEIKLGWSGSHSTSDYLNILKPAFEILSSKYKIKLIVIGDESVRFDEITTEPKKWNRSSEVSDLRNIDIGLYPLPNEQWVYGKSGLKALQYMALGIPTIATNIGTITRIIENNKNGILVSPADTQGWVAAIESLVKDPNLYNQFSVRARETIEQKFSVQTNFNVYLKVFESL